MVFMYGMPSSQGAGELPSMEGCMPVAGARFGRVGRLQSVCARRGQALAMIAAPP